jgi:hypothetical protein
MAMGDERAHTMQLGERQRLLVMGCPAFGVEAVGMGRNIPEQVERMGREARLMSRRFDCTIG